MEPGEEINISTLFTLGNGVPIYNAHTVEIMPITLLPACCKNHFTGYLNIRARIPPDSWRIYIIL